MNEAVSWDTEISRHQGGATGIDTASRIEEDNRTVMIAIRMPQQNIYVQHETNWTGAYCKIIILGIATRSRSR